MTIQADRKEAQLQKRLTDRVFADPEVVAILDDMPTDSLHHRYGEPAITTMFAQPQKHWRVGDGRPSLADEDPAVMQAVGRCAASRVRWEDKPAIFGPSIHPAVCDWCEFPLPELLRALNLPKVKGALITGVVNASPADKAGLKPGDVLVAVDSQRVTDYASTLNMISALKPGVTATLKVIRNRDELALKVNVGQRPKPKRDDK